MGPGQHRDGSEDAAPDSPDAAKPRSRAPVEALRRVARVPAWGRGLLPQGPEHAPSPRRRLWLLGMYVLRRWLVEDRCSHMAALLTMQTLLSTVPIIGVALLAVGLMDDQAGGQLLDELFRSLVPEGRRAAQMTSAALTLAKNVTVSNLGGLGFLATLTLAFALFSTLERTFNRIWRVTRRRSTFVQFTMFYTLATLGPLVMLYSLAQPLIAGLSFYVATPLLATFLGLLLLNRFLPFTSVSWQAALAGAVVSALLLELGKVVFGIYAARFALRTYEGVYGSMAIFPILIIWSYISWMIVLLGAELTYAVHRRQAIALQGYVNRYVIDRTDYRRPNGRTASHIVLAICDQYARRQLGSSVQALGERFRMGLDHVQAVIDTLAQRGILTEAAEPTGLIIPARPLDQIRVLEILELFDRDWTEATRDDALAALLAEVAERRAQLLGHTTFADLVDIRGPDDPDGAARVRAPADNSNAPPQRPAQ